MANKKFFSFEPKEKMEMETRTQKIAKYAVFVILGFVVLLWCLNSKAAPPSSNKVCVIDFNYVGNNSNIGLAGKATLEMMSSEFKKELDKREEKVTRLHEEWKKANLYEINDKHKRGEEALVDLTRYKEDAQRSLNETKAGYDKQLAKMMESLLPSFTKIYGCAIVLPVTSIAFAEKSTLVTDKFLSFVNKQK